MKKTLIKHLAKSFPNLGSILTLDTMKESIQHRLWRIETSQGVFLVKQFSKNERYKIYHSSQIAELMLENGIPTRVPLKTRDKDTFIEMEGFYYQVFPWIAGAIVPLNETTIIQAQMIGKTLATIHNLTLAKQEFPKINWPYYSHAQWHDLFHQAPPEMAALLEICLEFTDDYKAAQDITNEPSRLVLSHGDFIAQNVVWQTQGQFTIIDWELAGLIHRDIELLGVALNWSGVVTSKIHPDLFCSLWQAYYQASILKPKLNQEIIDAGFGSWLAWIAHCLQAFNEAKDDDEREAYKNEIQVCYLALLTIRENRREILAWGQELCIQK